MFYLCTISGKVFRDLRPLVTPHNENPGMTELTLEQALQKGIEAHRAGQVQEADRLYTAILKAQPKHPDANHNMGVLAIGVGKVEQALPFFKTALEANPATAQFWLSFIDALIKLEQLTEAKAVLDQAKSKGAKGNGFDKLGQRLKVAERKKLETSTADLVEGQAQPNILDTLKLDQAIKLATKRAKDGFVYEAKRIYQDILNKFPKNKRASDGLKCLSESVFGKVSNTQDPPQDQLQSLIDLYRKGQFQSASKKIQHLVLRFPRSAILYQIQGMVLKALGQLESSVLAYKKALAINPNSAEIHYNMGNAFNAQGKLKEAVDAFIKALAIEPNNHNAYLHIGNILKAQDKHVEAIDAYRKALAIKPNYAGAYINIGVIFKEQGKLDGAIEAYSNAIAVDPDKSEAYNNLGIILSEKGMLKEAIEAYTHALTIDPNYADAYYNLGVTLTKQSKFSKAMQAYKKSLAIKPHFAEAYANIGNILSDQSRPEEAIAAYKKALAIRPDFAEACNNMGTNLQQAGHVKEAIEAFNSALAAKPDYAEAHRNLSFALLNVGLIKQGLAEYEWRWKTSKGQTIKRKFLKPQWDGQKCLMGQRILLWAEQGIGDTINWSSYLPLISSLTDHIILECPNKLLPLLARSFPNIEIKSEEKQNDEQRNDFDCHLPLGSLPHLFLSKITKKTNFEPHLIPDPTRVKFWQERLKSIGHGPFIGVSWKSINMSRKRLPHYATISDWSPIFTMPKATLINLQYANFATDLFKIQNDLGVNIHNFDELDQYNDLDNVAALSAALDIVVSTTSAVPMISAGVGTLTKLANRKESSWNNALFKPLNSSLETFEKNKWEPWEHVFQRIAKQISNSSGM